MPNLRRSLKNHGKKGYVMLVALILMAILAVIGATTLSVSGVDQRIALHNRKHMMELNTADAGTVKARAQLTVEAPTQEWKDSGDTGYYVTAPEAEADFGGISYPHNLGVYRVNAIYMDCGNPPPGYSTELGQQHYRSDYWQMESTARMQNEAYKDINETTATVVSTVRHVLHGPCIK
jgi:hypothetical protein